MFSKEIPMEIYQQFVIINASAEKGGYLNA